MGFMRGSDAFGSQIQRCCQLSAAALESRRSLRHQRRVTQFSLLAWRFPIQVKMRALNCHYALDRGNVSKDVEHYRAPARCSDSQRKREDGSQMIFELAGLRSLYGPVPGVVDSRRHLVGQ